MDKRSFGGRDRASHVDVVGLAIMQGVFADPTVRAVVGIVILCVLIAAGFYLVSIFRDYADEDRESSTEALAILQEMHLKGDISDEEFRTIEATTHRQLGAASDTDDSTSEVESPPDRQA